MIAIVAVAMDAGVPPPFSMESYTLCGAVASVSTSSGRRGEPWGGIGGSGRAALPSGEMVETTRASLPLF